MGSAGADPINSQVELLIIGLGVFNLGGGEWFACL